MSVLTTIERFANESSEAPAVVDRNGSRTTTYGELWKLAKTIAAELAYRRIEPGDAIVIRLPRSMEYIAVEIACLQAGIAFVPVSATYPRERIDTILNSCKACLLVDQKFVTDLADPIRNESEVDLGTCAPSQTENNMPLQGAQSPTPVKNYPASADDPVACILFTSGSTGRPKGVVYRRRAFDALADRVSTTFTNVMNEASGRTGCVPGTLVKHGSFALPSFVASLAETFGVLNMGGCVHLIDDEVRLDPKKIAEYYETHLLTMGFMPPSILKYYQNTDPALAFIWTAGQKLSGIYSGEYRLVNFYGATECCLVSSFVLDKPYVNTPIGWPSTDVSVQLVDATGNPAENEGVLIAEGVFPYEYLGLPEETARIFSVQPDGSVRVHTGDICKRLPQGELLLLNRADRMVKINGQRVEPDEISVALASLEGVSEAYSKAFDSQGGDTYLCSYYVADETVNESALGESLSAKLPDYMIPRFLVRLDEIPLNENGKPDASALAEPVITTRKNAYRAPSTPHEKALCSAFETILECGTVGLDDNFFALGGDSLAAVELVAECPLDGLEVRHVFEGKTPAGILQSCASYDIAPKPPIGHNGNATIVQPVSFSQRCTLAVCRAMGMDINMMQLMTFYELPTTVDVARLENALCETVRAHPIYSVSFDLEHDLVVPGKPEEFTCSHVELAASDFPEYRRRRYRDDRAETCRPRCEFAFIHTDDGKHYLLGSLSHLMFDGFGEKVFLNEVKARYEGRGAAPEDASAFDLMAWERMLPQTDFYEHAQAVQDAFFRNIPDHDLRSKKVGEVVRNAPILQDIGYERLSEEAAQRGISVVTIFYAALERTLGELDKVEEFVYRIANNGRSNPALLNTHGSIYRALYLASSYKAGQTVEEHLRHVEHTFQDLVYYDIGSDKLLRERYPQLNWRCPSFNYRDRGTYQFTLDGSAPIKPLDRFLDSGFKPFMPLQIDLDRMGERLVFTVAGTCITEEYADEFFKRYEAAIREMLNDHYA